MGLAGLAMPAMAADQPALRVGAAAVDISPTEFPFNMPGGFSQNLAEKVNDPFHARAVVFDDGTNAVALVVVDSLGVAAEAIEEAKALAAKKCGVPVENILVSSTHTHSGPPSNAKTGRPAEVAYRPKLIAGIADAVAQAHAARKPAKVAASSHPLPDEVFNRRWYLKPGKMQPNPFGLYDIVKMNPPNNPETLDRPAGPTDPDFGVIAAVDARNKPLALYASYSLHYVGGIPPRSASADYYGEFCRLVPARLGAGEGFVAALANGTSGNINNIPFGTVRPPREPMEQIRLVAAKAADAAWFAVKKIDKYESAVPVRMITRPITLKTRKPTPEQIARAKDVVAVKDEAELAKLPRLAPDYARRTLGLAGAAETITVPLQAIRIGDIAVVGIPFETFVETGLELKQKSPFGRTFVIGIANGYNGYLPTPAHHKLGGYETWLGTNRVQEDASDLITAQLLTMLGELKDAK
jgi:hypothetical protein